MASARSKIICVECGRERLHCSQGHCKQCYEKKFKRGLIASKRHPRRGRRSCLKCDREFASDGIHNRICPSCNETNARNAGIAEARLPGVRKISAGGMK